MGQQVKDLALSLHLLRSLLWAGFDPMLGNFQMPQVQPKKKKKKLTEERKKFQMCKVKGAR